METGRFAYRVVHGTQCGGQKLICTTVRHCSWRTCKISVRDEHVNSLVQPAVQKLKSVVCVCVIQLDDRRSHLGTSEQLCMIVQSEISEVTLAPVWYRPGFLMDIFGLEVNQITGMCPALCYALRLALLSHNVSLRFQSIMVPSFSVYFRTNVHNKVTYRSSGAELFPYTFVKFSIIKCHSLHQLTSQRHWQHSC